MNFVLRRLGILLVIACLAACSGAIVPEQAVEHKVSDRVGGLVMAEASRQFVAVEAVGTRTDTLGAVLPGRIVFRPQAMTAIGSPVVARVLSIGVRPGETVKTGRPLMTLQSADVAAARAILNQAAARNAAAEDLLKRQNEMIRKGVGLEVERFSAETAVREARAELERAKHMTALIGEGKGDRFVLRAPVDGVVLDIKVSIGTVVSPGGDALVEIGDPDELWAIADISESEISHVTVGQSARIRVPAIDTRLDAIVDGIGQAVDGEQRRIPVYLSFKEKTGYLSSGMLAEVRLSTVSDTSLNLPASAILIKEDSQQIVYVQRSDGSFEPRPVRTGNSYDGRVIILEGLQAGEEVVVKGALLLDGTAEQLL
ncbi:efflux RND transporter periplasmic adaptor subunit [Nitrosomonas sp. HPC101]|uniref:efflux RND transporter periplasmic adaptor subunit n=1 Tax=Nitrosomonas sp. HPC101 TaxID=1658667 RepID=UPI00136E2E77|nr:efflux RND transporter periplasmic adaptor subunit [Nitrosomonas sp. HPC101]